MSKEYLEMLEATVKDLENLSPEKLQAFMAETVSQLLTLQTKLASKDQSVREEGVATAKKLKEALEAQMEDVLKATGLDKDQMEALAAHPDLAALNQARETLMKGRSKKANKINLVG
jgi:hypothetical protein